MRLDDIDRDGAIVEALDELHGTTRAAFLRRAAVGSAALLAASAVPASAAVGRRDAAILNYALTLEFVQDAFYSEVDRIGALSGALAEQARVVGAHERAHVKALREALGSRAVKRPRFDFRGATEDAERFRKTAVAFEDLAVAAYKGQAPLIQSRAYLVPALAIHSVEARHAAWIRRLAGITPAADRVRRAALDAQHARGRRGHALRRAHAQPAQAEVHGVRLAEASKRRDSGLVVVLSARAPGDRLPVRVMPVEGPRQQGFRAAAVRAHREELVGVEDDLAPVGRPRRVCSPRPS